MAYNVGRGVGSDVLPIAVLAPALGPGAGLAGALSEIGLGVAGSTAARTAQELGAGEIGQMAADVAGSLTPAAAGKSLAALPLAAVAREATREAVDPAARALQERIGGLAPNVTRLPLEERITRYLTPEEQQLVTPQDRINMDRILQTAATPNELVAMAAAGGAKRGWYRSSARAVREVFGDDADRFAAVLSATSPQTSVESNLRNTLNIWKNWDAAGRPTDRESILSIMGQSVEGELGDDSVLDAWKNNTVRALSSEDPANLQISGPKVNSFAQNLRGNLREVTNDTHQARGLGMRQSPDFAGRTSVKLTDEVGKLGFKNAGYLAGNLLTREAADLMTRATGEPWQPAEIQETVWSWVKAITDRKKKIKDPKKQRSVPSILESGELTDDAIADTPDFATLFSGNNEFHDILREAGYEDRIQQLSAPDFGQGRAIGAGARPSRALEASARRLDRATRRRGEAGTGEDLRQLSQRTSGRLRPSGPAPVEGPAFRRSNRKAGRGVLANQPVQEYQLPKDVQKQYAKLGVPTPALQEFKDPNLFWEMISQAKETNVFGDAVYVYPPEEYAGMRTFMTPDGTAGVAIKPDGDIVSVFNRSDGPHKGIAPHLVTLAVAEGGTKLDAYDIGGGLERIYGDVGFDTVRRDAWDEAYRPPGWNEEVMGTPDVIYMELAPAAGTSEVESVVRSIGD
jgi:hypothetical protein